MELITQTLGGIIKKWADETPDKEFLISPYLDVKYTYAEFSARVDALALAFAEMGVERGKKVGIWANNHPDWITVFFASARLGAVLVTVNTNYKAAEVEYLMRNADIHTMCLIEGYRDSNYVDILHSVAPEMLGLADDDEILCDKLPEFRHAVFIGEHKPTGMHNIDELVERGKSLPREWYDALQSTLDCHDEVNMQYTSGTTGFPKGVLLTHYNILNNGKATGEAMKYTSDDRLLVCVPMFHCFGCVLALCAVITHGATMVMIENFDPLQVLESVDKERCTILYGVPTMFIAELNHPDFDKFDLTSLRTGIMAGAVCPIETMNAVMERMHCRVISVYGLTESSPGMTVSLIDDSTQVRATTVGREYPSIEVKILDHNTGEELPDGEAGEVCCRGWNVMKGYYKNPEATAEVIDERGFLHSGDLGLRDKDGYFHITGRIKDIIIRGGENVSPREVENYLFNIAQIKGVEVVGLPSPRYGEQVTAFITLKAGESLTEAQVRDFCEGNISRHKIPKYIFFIEEFPMTASGKIQKYRLRELGVTLLKQRGEEVV